MLALISQAGPGPGQAGLKITLQKHGGGRLVVCSVCLSGGPELSILLARMYQPFRAGVAVLVCVLAQSGDLIESGLKRRRAWGNGSFVPEHGGALDRFDGYLSVLPVVMLAEAITSRHSGSGFPEQWGRKGAGMMQTLTDHIWGNWIGWGKHAEAGARMQWRFRLKGLSAHGNYQVPGLTPEFRPELVVIADVYNALKDGLTGAI